MISIKHYGFRTRAGCQNPWMHESLILKGVGQWPSIVEGSASLDWLNSPAIESRLLGANHLYASKPQSFYLIICIDFCFLLWKDTIQKLDFLVAPMEKNLLSTWETQV